MLLDLKRQKEIDDARVLHKKIYFEYYLFDFFFFY